MKGKLSGIYLQGIEKILGKFKKKMQKLAQQSLKQIDLNFGQWNLEEGEFLSK